MKSNSAKVVAAAAFLAWGVLVGACILATRAAYGTAPTTIATNPEKGEPAALAVPATPPPSTAAVPEVLAANGPGVPHHDFSIFTLGTGNTAKGSMTVWQGTCTTGGCTKWQLTTIEVTCVQFQAWNDAVITGTTTYRGTAETVVAEAVDNSNPNNPSNPDLLRFSYAGFITKTGTPGCDTPTLAPVTFGTGDIRVLP